MSQLSGEAPRRPVHWHTGENAARRGHGTSRRRTNRLPYGRASGKRGPSSRATASQSNAVAPGDKGVLRACLQPGGGGRRPPKVPDLSPGSGEGDPYVRLLLSANAVAAERPRRSLHDGWMWRSSKRQPPAPPRSGGWCGCVSRRSTDFVGVSRPGEFFESTDAVGQHAVHRHGGLRPGCAKCHSSSLR
jgi:hypothetical protein